MTPPIHDHCPIPHKGSSLPPEKAWALRQMIFAEVLRLLDSHFGTAGLDYMPIKGANLICTGLAEKLPNRKMLDIDILVHPKDFDKAKDYFLGTCAFTERKGVWPFEFAFEFPYAQSIILVEIHRALNYESRFLLNVDDLFASARRQTKRRCLSSLEHALVVMICHLLVHIAHEVPPTTFKEIRFIAEQEKFSWDTFWKECRKTGIMAFGRYVMTLAEKQEQIHSQAPSRHGWAAKFAQIISYDRYCSMKIWQRRLCLELLFVRRPLRLLWAKGIHRE